jgi:hypothetical protein
MPRPHIALPSERVSSLVNFLANIKLTEGYKKTKKYWLQNERNNNIY